MQALDRYKLMEAFNRDQRARAQRKQKEINDAQSANKTDDIPRLKEELAAINAEAYMPPAVEDDGSGPSTPNEEKAREERLLKLIEMLRGQSHNSHLVNASFETGRPMLQPPAHMLANPANPYSRLSINDLYNIRVAPVSMNVANTEQITRIIVCIGDLGVPTEHCFPALLQMVFYCKDASSSEFLDPEGTVEVGGVVVPLDSLVAICKEKATLRKVCRLYAPMTWNHMLTHHAPPANWAAMEFPANAKYAAFDCFDYVENEAAVKPIEGLIRRPTPAEKIAHNAHKQKQLDISNRNETYANYDVEYTGGRLGPLIQRNHNNANNK